MIPLKTGPYLALDASSSGDSYFVKIKLKSISNVPAVCCSQGGGRGPGPNARTASRAQGWMVASGTGRTSSVGCEVQNTLWTVGGSGFGGGERLEGWASLNQNPTHKGHPTVALSKETHLLFHLLEVFLQVRRVLGRH